MAPKKSELNLEQLAFEEERKAKWKLLEPRILSVVSALGGFEDVLVPAESADGEDEAEGEPREERIERIYRLGDECLGCLKDLKKFWRLDDHDDDRTVARILHKSKVLPNDLLPILKSVEGTGSRGTRIALLCCKSSYPTRSRTALNRGATADIIAALTWPIDVAAELRESADLEDEEAQRAAANVDYSGLVAAQLSYKRDILRTGALGPIFRLIVPALDKPRRCVFHLTQFAHCSRRASLQGPDPEGRKHHLACTPRPSEPGSAAGSHAFAHPVGCPSRGIVPSKRFHRPASKVSDLGLSSHRRPRIWFGRL